MDKLTVINRALLATGNRPLNVLYDGSDEWQVADQAFDRAVTDLMSRYGWSFGVTTATLVPVSTNTSLRYAYAYALPPDLWHLRSVFVNSSTLGVDYEIQGRTISLPYSDASGYTVQIEYVRNPDVQTIHPQAEVILTLMVEAGCLRGLNEDFAEAERRDNRAEQRLMEVRSLMSQENEARAVFIGAATQARRYRAY